MALIAYDCSLRRPGCAIVQAAMGGDTGIANHFTCEVWLTEVTADMKLYSVSPDELDRLIKMTERVK